MNNLDITSDSKGFVFINNDENIYEINSKIGTIVNYADDLNNNNPILLQKRKVGDLPHFYKDSKKQMSLGTLFVNSDKKTIELQTIAEKFTKELKLLLYNIEKEKENFTERVKKSLVYFTNQITINILQPLQFHINEMQQATKVKQYVVALKSIELDIWGFVSKLNNIVYDDIVFNQNKEAIEKYNPAVQKVVKVETKSTVPTAQQTFDLYKEGRNVEQIAVIRNFAESTIAGHLAQYVRKGELDVYTLVTKEKLENIFAAFEKLGRTPFKPIMDYLGDSFTYNYIRAASNYKEWLEEQKR
jgi:uncharacterized protein YpbB